MLLLCFQSSVPSLLPCHGSPGYSAGLLGHIFLAVLHNFEEPLAADFLFLLVLDFFCLTSLDLFTVQTLDCCGCPVPSYVLNILPQGIIPVRGGSRISWSLYLCAQAGMFFWGDPREGLQFEPASQSGPEVWYRRQWHADIMSNAKGHSSPNDSVGTFQNLGWPTHTELTDLNLTKELDLFHSCPVLWTPPPQHAYAHLGIFSAGRERSCP